MEKGLISIIVPCYNVEKFLEDCLISIEKQTYKNFEVFFVNDGSTDNTLKILQSICNDRPNFYVIDQKNSGPSVARNTALAQAKGEFIYFCDSDDMLNPNILEFASVKLEETGADMLVFRAKWFKESKKYGDFNHERKMPKKAKVITDLDEMMSLLYTGEIGYSIWNKLYRRNIIEKIVNFPDVMNVKSSYGEDIEFNTDYIRNSSSLAVIKTRLYYYRKRKGGLVRSKFNEKKLSVFYGLDKADQLDETTFKQAKTYIKSQRAISSLEMLFRIGRSDYREANVIRKLYSDLKSNIKYVITGRKNAFYLRCFLPVVIPYFRVRFNKYLKKKSI